MIKSDKDEGYNENFCIFVADAKRCTQILKRTE
jgi:hypothetical protein